MFICHLENPNIDQIIDYCDNLLSGDKLEVYDFGLKGDLVLHIYKDEYYNPDMNKEDWNLVDITTIRNEKVVDDAIGIHVTDGLFKELIRINHYEDYCTL